MTVFGGVVLAIALAVGLAEAAGWPFLVGPAQRWVAAKLDRRIAVSSDAEEAGRVRIGLLGSVRVEALLLEIGAPAWSDEPYMVRANNADLVLAYGDLWRAWRGEPLRIRRLRADTLDARIERLADGRASWQFGPPTAPDPEHVARLPSFGELRVGDGKVVFRDAILEADLDARFSLTERAGASGVGRRSAAASPGSSAASGVRGTAASTPSAARTAAPASEPASASDSGTVAGAAGSSGLELHATGKYRRLPLNIDLTTSGVLDVVGPDGDKLSQPVKLLATIGRARLRFEGVAGDALHLARLKGRFDVTGPSLAAVGDPLGVTLPTTGAFQTRGTLEKQGEVWKADFDEAAIGESRLDGSFTFDRRPATPLLSGRLGGSRLVLADLGPVVGAAAPAAAPAKDDASRRRVLPDREFDLPSLRAMDADVTVEIAYLDLGTSLLEPLKPLRTHLQLRDGVLTLNDLDARTAEGRLTGNLSLDGRAQKALWKADLQLVGVRLERWLHQGRKNDAPPYVSGFMDGQVKVAGAGRSTAEILGSLDGAMRFHLRNARISHLAVEAAGLDPAQALGVMFKGDEALAIHCNVADMGVAKGLATPRIFVIDTDDSTIWITGSLSLRTEALDLTAVVSPKDFSPLALRTPIHVKGTFSNPAISIDKARLGAKVGAAALLSLLNPLAALIPFIDPGATEDAKKAAAQCSSLAQRSNLAKVDQPAPAKTPKK